MLPTKSLLDTLRSWLQRDKALLTVDWHDPEFAAVAQDLCVSPSQLDELTRRGRHSADELRSLLAALGLHKEAPARVQPYVLRDLERVCALCHDKARCRRDIKAHLSASHYREYCPNAETIDAVK